MTHNTTNKLKAHVRPFLESMVNYADVYLVCNFKKQIESSQIPEGIKDVFYRDNTGWDSGAFKDVIIDSLGWDEIRKYEELLLVNDSFYGPLYPLEETFKLFENDECDFWGITGQNAGYYENPRYDFPKHVHSYFYGFKKNIIKSDGFKQYWQELEYPVTFRDAVIIYEVKLNQVLNELGFKGNCYTNYYNFQIETNENPFLSRPNELVEKLRVPLLKRKSLLIRNKGFVNTIKCIDYIEKNLSYPVDGIREEIYNQFFNYNQNGKHILDFIDEHNRIYIYGNGVCGKNLAIYFESNNRKFDAFVTTSGDEELGILKPEQMKIDDKTGVIISIIDPKVSEEVKGQLLKNFKEEQLFLLYDCPAIRIPV